MTAFVFAAVMVVVAPVPKDNEFEKGVATARERAIDFLKKQRNKDGLWYGGVIEAASTMEGGGTALVTLSLLEAGVSPDDAALKTALEYLAKLEPKKTYVVSLQTQVLARANAKKYAKEIQAGADWLLKNATKKGEKVVGWSYPANDLSDGSNTHFAVVALHAAAQAGAKIDDAVWGQVRDHYLATRGKAGWAYFNQRTENPTGSMTLCGTLGLVLAAKHDKNPNAPGAEIDKAMAAAIELRGPSDKSEGTGCSRSRSWVARWAATSSSPARRRGRGIARGRTSW